MKDGWQAAQIGGVPQWLSVRGSDVRAPVLLYLHGGPGGSEYGPRRKYLARLERRWRVVEWEQRGAGRSYRGDETRATLTFARLVLDGVEVVDWARRALGVERIVLVGHSFGTVLGVAIAQRVPERLRAYVGVSQVVDWAAQETHGYDFALSEARRRDDTKAVRSLERIGRPVDGAYAIGVRGVEIQRRWLGTFGGIAPSPSFLLRWVLSTMTVRDYPIAAKLGYSRAMRRSMELLWSELGREIDLVRTAPSLSLPVQLFHGRSDHITPLELVERWYKRLAAPSKRLEVVDGAGHLVPFETPDRFIDFLEPLRDAP